MSFLNHHPQHTILDACAHARSSKHKNTHITRNRFPWMLKLYATHNIPHRANPIPFLEQTHIFLFSTGRTAAFIVMFHSPDIVCLILCEFRLMFRPLYSGAHASSLVLLFLWASRAHRFRLWPYQLIVINNSLSLRVFQFDAQAFRLFYSFAVFDLNANIFFANGSSRGSVFINIWALPRAW